MPPRPSTASASPSLRASCPGLFDSVSYSRSIIALVTWAMGPSSYTILSALRPFTALQNPSATTAMPLLTCTTCFTPGTCLANDRGRGQFLSTGTTGGRSIEAISMPGTCTSIP